jgi:tRNA 2-thiouridine synthesizing protein A
MLDLRGLKCPLPALFAKRALRGAPRGASVEIVADDPLAAVDIPHMCHREEFAIVSLERDGEVTRMVLRKP